MLRCAMRAQAWADWIQPPLIRQGLAFTLKLWHAQACLGRRVRPDACHALVKCNLLDAHSSVRKHVQAITRMLSYAW